MFYVLRPFVYLAKGKNIPLHRGSFFTFIYDLSVLLTSTAIVHTNANIEFGSAASIAYFGMGAARLSLRTPHSTCNYINIPTEIHLQFF